MGRPIGCIDCEEDQCCRRCPPKLWVSISGVNVCACIEDSPYPCFDPEVNNPNGVWLVNCVSGGMFEGALCLYNGDAGPCRLQAMYYQESEYVANVLATGEGGYFVFNGGGSLNVPFSSVTDCGAGSAADGGLCLVYLAEDHEDED
ncbi:MAG TPA: hypothetical protein VK970_00170 [Candidatus Methylacidiphilales bacterium]|nr:hypothetical protein [Candidatus Methylacidiphilales bacterium]